MRALKILTAIFAAAFCVVAVSLASANAPSVYNYRIEHPQYGDIGTYTNTIARGGDGTITVDTRVRIAVKIATVTMFRLEADRREDWQNGRLVAYQSTTDKNGKMIKVEGRAEGDKFVIRGPKGTEAAPSGVWPSNPWSPAIINAPMIMGSASGKLYEQKVKVTDQQQVELGDKRVATRHFHVVTDEPNDLWFDQSGRLVKFATVEDDQPITLTLQ